MRKRITRYPASLSVCALLTLLVILSACSTNSSNTPKAQDLIKKSQDAINKVKSYHFNLKTENMGDGTPKDILVRDADGDIAVPDKLKANAQALAYGFPVEVQLIAVDDTEYLTDPITGKWTKTATILDPRALSDPQTGVAALLGRIQNPGEPTDSNVDGKSCWNINGQLEARDLSAITGGGTPSGSVVDTTVCIGKDDSLPYLIRLKGVALKSDKPDTVRTFKLSKFDEPVTITAPKV